MSVLKTTSHDPCREQNSKHSSCICYPARGKVIEFVCHLSFFHSVWQAMIHAESRIQSIVFVFVTLQGVKWSSLSVIFHSFILFGKEIFRSHDLFRLLNTSEPLKMVLSYLHVPATGLTHFNSLHISCFLITWSTMATILFTAMSHAHKLYTMC